MQYYLEITQSLITVADTSNGLTEVEVKYLTLIETNFPRIVKTNVKLIHCLRMFYKLNVFCRIASCRNQPLSNIKHFSSSSARWQTHYDTLGVNKQASKNKIKFTYFEVRNRYNCFDALYLTKWTAEQEVPPRSEHRSRCQR